MINAVTQLAHKVRFKIFYLLFGLAAGSGGVVLAQICPGPGQCANCGACLTGVPILILLFLAARRFSKRFRKGALALDGYSYFGRQKERQNPLEREGGV